MRSDPQELRRALAELERTLQGEVEIDPPLRAQLEEAAAEIGELLDRTSGEGHLGGGTLSGRVSELALAFELSHPTLTGVLNRITHQLASLGI